MYKITNNINIRHEGNKFFVEYITKNETFVCYSDYLYQRHFLDAIGLLDQILKARAWFVCTSNVDINNLAVSFNEEQTKTLEILDSLNRAVLVLGGKEYVLSYVNRNSEDGEYKSDFIIMANDKKFRCSCDIKWKYEKLGYDDEPLTLVYSPVFYWKEETAQTPLGDLVPTIHKVANFGRVFSNDWVKILDNQKFDCFLKKLIENYN